MLIRQATLPFVADLHHHGQRVALSTRSESVTYGELAERIDEARGQLGASRSLVWLGMTNEVSSVVAYLAALSAGHPVMVTAPCQQELAQAYGPNISMLGDVIVSRSNNHHQLHPDLALLLSTSGSTGSPRLARLSHDNLQSNAASIADYLALRPEDVGITSLPLHYCYGLSVLHSHLLAGASIVLTTDSVTDDSFWQDLHQHKVTNLAGVPHTFDLLERVGFPDKDLPSLRFVTQAGGRMPTEQVRRYAELGQRRGFDFYVMYGQTEATARMSYLPPNQTLDAPDTVGIAVPGGRFRLQNEHDGVGELVYAGPNVMLGYATQPEDLAKGREIDELHTGDLARIREDGLVQIVGRSSRFAKVFGLRIDLESVERDLDRCGWEAAAAEDDAGLVVATTTSDLASVAQQVGETTGLPTSAVFVRQVPELPRLANGKIDYPAVRVRPEEPLAASSVAEVYAVILAKQDISDRDTFVSLGGDSLSYVAAASRLERLLGHLPPDWQLRTVAELNSLQAGASRWRQIEVGVFLRAIAIVAVVGSHIGVFDIRGGAHLLLVIAGLNFARFQLRTPDLGERRQRMLRSWARIVVPSALWIAVVVVLGTEYGWSTLFGTNLFGPDQSGPEWRYWFIETIGYLLLAVAALLAVPRVHKWEQTSPFAFSMGLVGLGLVLRYTLTANDGPSQLYTPVAVFWFFAIGWALAQASNRNQRLLALAALAVGLPGYFDDPWRALFVAVGVGMLALLATLRVPAWSVAVISAMATGSLFIYLTHWQVYPPLEQWPWLALGAAIAAGIAIERGWRLLTVNRRQPVAA